MAFLLRSARWLALALLTALPLIAWPGEPQPFSTPKYWTLLAGLLLLLPLSRRARSRHRRAAIDRARAGDTAALKLLNPTAMTLLPALWMLSYTWSAWRGDIVSLDVWLQAAATAMLLTVLLDLGPAPEHVAAALVIGATAVAAIAIAQWIGVDPFALAGWVPPINGMSGRLRVYGTLGNPNFVAALLAATLPLTVSLMVMAPPGADGQRPRRALPVLSAAVVLQLAGILATGSRGGALGVLAGALTWALLIVSAARQQDRRLVAFVAIAGALAALLAVAISTGRPLLETFGGRAYIVRVAWPHAFEAPWTGRGPGAFAALYPAWEREARHRPDLKAEAHAFAGPQQHAHNDYLEALIERGLAGPVTILAILATCFTNGWRQIRAARRAPLAAGALAMLAALAMIACVDFPLARPTEAAWWWCGAALIALIERQTIQ